MATADLQSTGLFLGRYHEGQANVGRQETETARLDQTQMTQSQLPILFILSSNRESSIRMRRMISMGSGNMNI